MALSKQNPKIPEGINTSQEHPFKDFLILLSGVSLAIIVVVILLSIFAQSLATYIPFRYEQQLTGIYETATSEFSSQDTPLDTLVDAEAAIQELGAELLLHADMPQDMDLSFHLIDAPDMPNAFATLGGHIFVTTGLLHEVSSENALALVVAHEIAHIKYRHPIQALGRGVIIQLTLGIFLGSQDSAAIQSLLGQTSLITLLSFNREMEHEADDLAHEIMLKQYGHLNHADEFFARMASLQGRPGWKEVFQTHPDVAKRIKKLNQKNPASSESAVPAIPLDHRIQTFVEKQLSQPNN